MGRNKMIESPEILWNLFQDYKIWAKENPFKITDWVGAKAVEVEREKERPLTMEGFERHVFSEGLNGELSHYFSNKENRYSDFVAICLRIRNEIRGDQIEGGMAGMYNPSITQRLNNLVEKIQEDGTKKVIIEIVDGDTDKNNNTETT